MARPQFQTVITQVPDSEIKTISKEYFAEPGALYSQEDKFHSSPNTISEVLSVYFISQLNGFSSHDVYFRSELSGVPNAFQPEYFYYHGEGTDILEIRDGVAIFPNNPSSGWYATPKSETGQIMQLKAMQFTDEIPLTIGMGAVGGQLGERHLNMVIRETQVK